MTESEALKFFKDFIEILRINGEEQIQKNDYCKASNIAIKALEKQIPKKPKMRHFKKYDRYNDGWCPCCESYVIEENNKNFCSECGQRLDWGDCI